MYQSYSVSNMPKPVNTHSHEPKRQHEPPAPRHTKPREPERQPQHMPAVPRPEKKKGLEIPFLGRLQTDDIILLAVILLLLSDDCDDKLLLLALAYVFFSDYFDGDDKKIT